MKGKKKNQDWEENLPPGSHIYMSPKSSYINSELFIRWLEEAFFPNLTGPKNLLILDGHGSHMQYAALELCRQHDVIVVCLPSHTTHKLQPLDVSIFGRLKDKFKDACNKWFKTQQGQRLTRYQIGRIIKRTWDQTAILSTASAGFRTTGILPFNLDIIPSSDFAIAANMKREEPVSLQLSSSRNQATASSSIESENIDSDNRDWVDSTHFQNPQRNPLPKHRNSKTSKRSTFQSTSIDEFLPESPKSKTRSEYQADNNSSSTDEEVDLMELRRGRASLVPGPTQQDISRKLRSADASNDLEVDEKEMNASPAPISRGDGPSKSSRQNFLLRRKYQADNDSSSTDEEVDLTKLRRDRASLIPGPTKQDNSRKSSSADASDDLQVGEKEMNADSASIPRGFVRLTRSTMHSMTANSSTLADINKPLPEGTKVKRLTRKSLTKSAQNIDDTEVPSSSELNDSAIPTKRFIRETSKRAAIPTRSRREFITSASKVSDFHGECAPATVPAMNQTSPRKFNLKDKQDENSSTQASSSRKKYSHDLSSICGWTKNNCNSQNSARKSIHITDIRPIHTRYRIVDLQQISPKKLSELTMAALKTIDKVMPILKLKFQPGKRAKQGASILTSAVNIERAKSRAERVKKTESKKNARGVVSGKEDKIKKQKPKKSSDDASCVGCGELHSQTQSTVNWIECVQCRKWLHETCIT
ncbi:uncharacterized protein C01G6.5 [Diachasma alloeum]|uniref:uncharacterized protein C01G6.5 n=1 Tax=Diachasma alloeum TaxID=454923 RepID=UPI0007384B02|nr:uncharacterized protein C01G6.5 [Diachasma alloeum]